MMAGAIWNLPMQASMIASTQMAGCGPVSDLNTVIGDLSDHEKTLPDDQPLVGWGLDPIFLQDERLSRKH